MKKTIFIILGVILILLVAAVWVYVFMYGKPENSAEIFTRFGFNKEDEEIIEIRDNPQPIDTGAVSIGTPTRLKQITTRPVAGAHISSSTVTFVEQGTGHVYRIDIKSNKETLISGTTIPQVTDAQFSPEGTSLAITSFSQDGTETIVGAIRVTEQNNGSIDGVVLPKNATNIAFEDASNMYYLLKNTTGSNGFYFNLEKETSTELFAIPLRDVHILWGTPHYVYTTPTATQTGYVYKIEKKGTLTFIAPGALGLLAVPYGDGVITTSITKKGHSSTAITKEGARIAQSLPFIPEKCIANPANITQVFCALPSTLGSAIFPDDWYMGTVGYTDILWNMDTKTGKALFMLDLKKESEKEIDVYKIYTDTTGMYILFINKNDNTLWLYNKTFES